MIKFLLDYSTGVPVYRQIIDQIRFGIASRQLKLGEQLPTVRALAVELKVNLNTVSKAYKELWEDWCHWQRVTKQRGVIMSRIILLLLIVFSFQACTSEKEVFEKPAVDKRVELISIVFRLAEKQEYVNEEFRLYSDQIDRYFEQHKNHELIQFTRLIINEYGIGFDAPMWLAVYLDDDLNLLSDVKDVWALEPQWTKENVEKFVRLLQQFNKDTQFDKFFEEHTELYADVIERFTSIYEQVDLDWYSSFFGKVSTETFSVKIGLSGWGNCYGVNLDYVNGNRKIYAIMGLWMLDKAGLPVFSRMPDLAILMHEFSHPFVDHLTETYKEAFRESGEKIYSALKDRINVEAYPSWEVVLDEALINAVVIKYMRDHHFEQSDIAGWINLIKGGFGTFWIEELADELESYDKQRDEYPTLDSYMFKLAEAYKLWTENLLADTLSSVSP